MLDALPEITSLAVDNYEADDIIATLTTQAEQEGMAVQICTGDRDAIQLVDQNVTVLLSRHIRGSPKNSRGFHPGVGPGEIRP